MTKPPLDDRNAEGADDAPSSATSAGGKNAFGFSDWMTDGTRQPLHPLMQHPTASVAAAAALGFGMASHFAGFMVGAMQGFVEAAQKSAKVVEPATEDLAQDSPHPDEAPVEMASSEPAPVDAGQIDAETAVVLTEPVEDVAETAADIASAAIAPVPDAAPLVKAPVRARPKKPAVPPTPEADAAVQDAAAVKVARPKRVKGPDDLKRISGIGPKLEQVLNGLGITRYAQIAGWDEAETARFDEALGVGGRIARDGWSTQAKALMKG